MSWLKLALMNIMNIPAYIECTRFYISFRIACTLLLVLVFDDFGNIVDSFSWTYAWHLQFKFQEYDSRHVEETWLL